MGVAHCLGGNSRAPSRASRVNSIYIYIYIYIYIERDMCVTRPALAGGLEGGLLTVWMVIHVNHHGHLGLTLT